MTAQEIADRLEARPTSNGWEARCPAHDDTHASLGIAEGKDGSVLVTCHAGCTFGAIVAAMGLKPADMFPPKREKPRRASQMVKASDYTDADGALLFQSLRYDPKDFSQRRPDGKGGWIANLRGVELVIYRLPEVLKAKSENRTIFVAEGEKDCDALASLGLCATCNPMGAGKWRDAYTKTLAGSRVIVIADKDGVDAKNPANSFKGQRHAAHVRDSLTGKAESVRVIELPDRDGHMVKDPADWIGFGGTVEELHEIVRTAPAWQPPEMPTVTAITSPAPNASVASIRARLWEIAQSSKLSTTERQRMTAAAVVEWLHAGGRFYCHAERRDFAGVMYFDTQRKLLLPVQGDAFLAWLADMLAMNRAERSFAFVQSACETEGLSERSTGIEPATYWAATPNAFYLSNGPGSMARIAAAGVEIVDNGTEGILFPYGATLAPWNISAPRDPFETCSLFRDLSTAAPHGRLLLMLWAMSLPTDQRTKPPLVLSGPVGSGKTRVVRGIFELYGMPQRIAAVLKNGEGDFWALMDAGGLTCFDNVDTRIDWLPDALAAASTAGTHEKRRLYTDADRVSLKARSSVCVTSASPSFAADAGVADRLLAVRVERRTGDTAETTLSDEIAANRDAGLSWIAQALSRALADLEAVPTGLNSRHPDFASMAVRIGRAIGQGEQAIATLQAAEADKGLFNLENDWIGAALLELLQAGPFDGTAAELLAALVVIDPSLDGKLSAKRLGKRLSKLWPHLESVLKAQSETSHGGFRHYTFQTPSGDFGDFQTAFSEKSLRERNNRTLSKTSINSHQSHQPTLPLNGSKPATPPSHEEWLAHCDAAERYERGAP